MLQKICNVCFFLVNFWSHLLAFLLLFAVISYSSSANEATEPEPGVLGRQDFSGGWLGWEKLESVWASQYEWKITHLCFLLNQLTLSYIMLSRTLLHIVKTKVWFILCKFWILHPIFPSGEYRRGTLGHAFHPRRLIKYHRKME